MILKFELCSDYVWKNFKIYVLLLINYLKFFKKIYFEILLNNNFRVNEIVLSV